MAFWRYLRHASKIVHKSGSDPIYLVVFVSDVCNAHCGHCLLGVGEPDGEEMTVDEYEKISRSMGPILFLLPTGGEPFLRDDIPEIVRIFCKNNKVANVGMPTNGSMTTKVIDGARRMLRENPGVDIAIDVSIDGIGAEHDRLRALPGLFEKAMWTFSELRKLEKEFPNFNANIATTMSVWNQDRVVDVYRYLKEHYGVENVNNIITRTGARSSRARDIRTENYIAWSDMLRTEVESNELKGYHDYPFSDFINAMKNIRQDTISKMVREDAYQLPCYAAQLGGIIYGNGDVYPCELLDEKLGNLKEVDYDFRKIWHSERTESVRRMIRDTKCYCSYECFMTMSVLFTPQMMPKVFAEWLRIKYGRLAAEVMGRGRAGANGSPSPALAGANGNGGGNAGPVAPATADASAPMGFTEPIHVPLASIRARARAAREASRGAAEP
jgi:MoaA/NifB/PqqE/SkfB family radical SAM enzyme